MARAAAARTLGAEVKIMRPHQAQRLFGKLMVVGSYKALFKGLSGLGKCVLTTTATPATNNADTDPGAADVFIIDADASTVWYCTAYTDATTYTLVQLVS